MSQRTRDILARWVADSLRPVSAEARSREAKRLAAEFAAYAADAGINLDRLEEELGTDLAAYMEEALDAGGG